MVGNATAMRARDGVCGEPTFCVAIAGTSLPDGPPDDSHFLPEEAPAPGREDLLPEPRFREYLPRKDWVGAEGAPDEEAD